MRAPRVETGTAAGIIPGSRFYCCPYLKKTAPHVTKDRQGQSKLRVLYPRDLYQSLLSGGTTNPQTR